MRISPKVITTNSVNFGAFGAFRWKYFLQLVIHIVSFDKDFDKTELGRKTPFQILKQLNQ